jgi:TrmH family RNA methyltransferase
MISKNQLKHIQALHLKKNREEERLFIIEGIKLVTEFIGDSTFIIKDIFATSEYIDKYQVLLTKNKVQYTEITTEELKKISLQSAPNQVLAIVHQHKAEINLDLLNSSNSLFLDDIRDPGNLGTIIRIADWFGIKQVICSQNSTEIYNPKTLQASMGAILRVNVIYMDFDKLITLAPAIPIYGAVLEGDNIYTTKLKQGILVIGNEANGISLNVLKYVTNLITIPAASNNGSESLNAANACAIICGEFHRQLHYE